MDFERLKAAYCAHSFVSHYVIGLTVGDSVKSLYFDSSAEMFKCSKLENSARLAVRFRPNKADKIALLAKAVKVETLCNVERFQAETIRLIPNAHGKPTKYNKGETFERLFYEQHGQEWAKDNREWWNDADITLNGIGYQLKHESNATIFTVRQLQEHGWL